MALLTAEDVLNKAFSKTKYREGFDQDEVDDFLDEVANAISALTAERDELQTRLAQYQAGGAPVAAAAPISAADVPAGAAVAPSDLLSAATDPNPPSATTMLSMAQRLHDDYVQAGEAERDRIIDEGKAKAESIVEQAETDARVRLQSLDAERAELEGRIDDLRRFERDYRGHLRNYLENLLGDLEHNAARGGVDAPGDETPSSAPERPVFGGAFDAEQPFVPQQTVVEGQDDRGAELDAPSGVEAPAESSPFGVHPEPFANGNDVSADTQLAAFPVTPPSEPSFTEPSFPAPSSPAPSFSAPSDPAPAFPAPSFPEELPPFPGTPQSASPFVSPFADANPFAPSAAPEGAHEPTSEPAAPTLADPEEEAPRWNF